jgi:RNA polymerase sigma-70 factor (ECF subfamily)
MMTQPLPMTADASKEGGPVDLALRQVERARGGDAAAFRWLFDRDVAGVRRFLGDLLRDRDAADEAAQETFVRAHRQLGELRDAARWRPFLFGTARRVSLEAMRRRARDPRSLEGTPDRADRRPDPEGALLGRESDRMLARALATLDEDRRAALVLRLDHGLDYDGIAEAMGWPPAKVKNELHRARVLLRAALGDYIEGES